MTSRVFLPLQAVRDMLQGTAECGRVLADMRRSSGSFTKEEEVPSLPRGGSALIFAYKIAFKSFEAIFSNRNTALMTEEQLCAPLSLLHGDRVAGA